MRRIVTPDFRIAVSASPSAKPTNGSEAEPRGWPLMTVTREAPWTSDRPSGFRLRPLAQVWNVDSGTPRYRAASATVYNGVRNRSVVADIGSASPRWPQPVWHAWTTFDRSECRSAGRRGRRAVHEGASWRGAPTVIRPRGQSRAAGYGMDAIIIQTAVRGRAAGHRGPRRAAADGWRGSRRRGTAPPNWRTSATSSPAA